MTTIPGDAIEAAEHAFKESLRSQHIPVTASWAEELRVAIEAAMPAIRQQLAEEIRSLSAGDPAKRADCCLHEPDICDRCYGREQAAQHIEHGGDQ